VPLGHNFIIFIGGMLDSCGRFIFTVLCFFIAFPLLFLYDNSDAPVFFIAFPLLFLYDNSDAPDDDYDVAYNDDDHDAIYEDLCALRRRVSLQVCSDNKTQRYIDFGEL